MVAHVLILFSLFILLSIYYAHLSVCLLIFNNFLIYVVVCFLRITSAYVSPFAGFGVIWGVGLLRNLSWSVVSLPRFIIKDRNPVRSGFRYVLRFVRLFTTTTIIHRLANGLGVSPVFYTGLGQVPSSIRATRLLYGLGQVPSSIRVRRSVIYIS